MSAAHLLFLSWVKGDATVSQGWTAKAQLNSLEGETKVRRLLCLSTPAVSAWKKKSV